MPLEGEEKNGIRLPEGTRPRKRKNTPAWKTIKRENGD